MKIYGIQANLAWEDKEGGRGRFRCQIAFRSAKSVIHVAARARVIVEGTDGEQWARWWAQFCQANHFVGNAWRGGCVAGGFFCESVSGSLGYVQRCVAE